MYIKEFTLKQHTPIIHFQANDTGATLRASEVKPKLDRFIYKKWLEEENGNKEETLKKYGCFTVGQTKEKWEKEWAKFEKLDDTKKKEYLKKFLWALDYAISFQAKGSNICKNEKLPMFFGNMGSDKVKKPTFHNTVIGKIKCKHKKDEKAEKKLLDYLLDYLPEFFFLHNFGTRQSKGYGSFTVETIEGVKNISKNVSSFFNYEYSVSNSNNSKNKKQAGSLQMALLKALPVSNENNFDKSINALEKTDWFYNSLRSGINLKNKKGQTTYYFKSALFMYVNNVLKKQWEKKTIKAEYFSEILEKQNNKHKKTDILNNAKKQDKDFKLKNYKDLLGLSSMEEWKFPYKTKIQKIDISDVVDRFKSPILFKPIIKDDGTISVFFDIFLNDEIKSYYGTKFKVITEDKDDLILPMPNEFNYSKFLNYTFEKIVPQKHAKLPKVYGDKPDRYAQKIHKSLEKIYNQLKKQTTK